jgi:hypothetical protein
LKDRVWKVSVASIGLATGPVSDMDRQFNISLISEELLLYQKAFGFEQQFVKDILKDDYIRQKLNASSNIEIQSAEVMHTFVASELKKLTTSEARESPNELTVPVIESLVLVWPAGEYPLRLLNQVLDGSRDDAKLVYSHLMNVEVSFFVNIYKNRIIVVIVSVFTSSVVDLGLEPK